jgi:hypothetical protein
MQADERKELDVSLRLLNETAAVSLNARISKMMLSSNHYSFGMSMMNHMSAISNYMKTTHSKAKNMVLYWYDQREHFPNLIH